MDINHLRKSYNHISDDYLIKKSKPWIDFEEYLLGEQWNDSDIVVDVGAGNARNLLNINCKHGVAFDLSYKLMKGYSGSKYISRVVGSLPYLPFRKHISSNSITIAVIHHLRSEELRLKSLQDIKRITTGVIILSVWRKWRKGVKENIITAIKNNEDTYSYFNVERPWKGSKGEIMSTRFYHYFTMYELISLSKLVKMKITRSQRLGGKLKDANFFITLSD